MTLSPAAVQQFAERQAMIYVHTRHYRRRALPPPDQWRAWLGTLFPHAIREPYAPYHVDFWHWIWAIEAEAPAAPFVAIWPRGYAKSTSAEAGVAMLAARRTRHYALYVSATQEQADTHVQNIASLLESPAFSRTFTAASRRKIGKYGNPAGWRRNRLRTASGFTVDAIGLDTAARGAKVDEARPDFLIFDDVDDVLDSPPIVQRKITTLTKSILPARADHAAVLVVQNMIHADGIVARLVDGRADYLAGRHLSGPHPAIAGLTTELRDGKTVITGGESTWPAKSLADLQHDLDDMGITAFLSEKQHAVDQIAGGIFSHVTFPHCTWADLPPLERIVVWVDPAVTDTDQSDAHGIQADGIAGGIVYRLFSWEERSSPELAIRRAILKARELKAEAVGIETDQGGDTWESTYELVWRKLVDAGEIGTHEPVIEMRQAKAGAGHGPKAHRASQMLAAYERAQMVHVTGTHETLERALRRFLIRKPYDLVDAAYWSYHDLTGGYNSAIEPLPAAAAAALSDWLEV